MKTLIKNKIFLIIMLMIIIIALPVAVYLVQQQQKLRSRAAAITGKATLALSPSTKNDAAVGGDGFSVDLILDVPAQADSFSISAVDITIEFDNSLEMTGFTVEPGRFNRVLMPTSTISSWSNFENPKYFRFVAADTQNSAILGSIKLGAIRFKFIRPAVNAFVRFNQEKSRLTSRATQNAWDYLQPTLTTGSYSTLSSPAPSVSPGPSASPSPGPRIRGDAAVTADRCVDKRDYDEWLLEFTRRSPRRDADWAGGTTDIGNNIKPDGIVDPRDRDAWLEECLYGQNACPTRNCYGD